METAEMIFVTVFAGYRTTDYKCNEDVREELGRTDISPR
jgi:hypothetical protein